MPAVARRRHPTGRHYDLNLYQTMGGSDGHVYVYKRARDTGLITQIGSVTLANSGVGFGIVVSPDGKHVYVADNNTANNLLYTYSRGTDGLLTLVGTNSTSSNAAAAEGAWGVAISPNGKWVYVVNNTGTNPNIAAFTRNASTGVLTIIANYAIGTLVTSQPKECVVSPDSKNLYVVNAGTSGNAVLNAYRIDQSSGGLSVIGGITADNTPRAPVVTPDGNHVYVCNQGSNILSCCTRAADGTLNFTSQTSIATGTSPRGLAVSPNGRMIYALNTTDSTISVYRRNVSDGSLTAVGSAVATANGPIGSVCEGGQLYTGGGIDGFNLGPDGSLSRFFTGQGNAGFYIAAAPFNP